MVSDDDIGELAADVDEFADGPPFDEALDVRIREGGLAHRSLVGLGSDRHAPAKLAVHLHDDLDGLADKRAFVDPRPLLIDHRSRVTERLPQRMTDMRNDR